MGKYLYKEDHNFKQMGNIKTRKALLKKTVNETINTKYG